MTHIQQSTNLSCLLQVSQRQPSNSITSICCGFVSTADKILTDIFALVHLGVRVCVVTNTTTADEISNKPVSATAQAVCFEENAQ